MKKLLSLSVYLFLSLNIFIVVPTVYAATTPDYVPLAPLQDGNNNPIPYNAQNFTGYIAGMYKLFISLAGVLAIVVIIYGGILYMTTDAYGKKEEGKKMIQRALWGLVIIIGSYLILQTINPQVLNLSHIFGDFSAGSNASNTTVSPGTGGGS